MSQFSFLQWRKSSYSNGTGANCVEVSAGWRKSTRSNGAEADCVEAAVITDRIAVRDSKLPTAGGFPVLTMTPADWVGLLAQVSMRWD